MTSYERLQRADTFMSKYPMKWQRVLGIGGYGIAVKYERTGPDGHVDDVVVKVDKKGREESFLREWIWYKARRANFLPTTELGSSTLLGQGG